MLGNKILVPEHGTGTAHRWPRQGILSAAMGRATARNLAFRQRLGGSARGRIFLADSAWAQRHFYRRQSAWRKILKSPRQLARFRASLYIGARTTGPASRGGRMFDRPTRK
jgi:hypothetical protein